MAEAVAEDRVVPGIGAEHEHQDEGKQDPADGVARLAAGDDHAHDGVDRDDGGRRPDVQEGQLADEAVQHDARGGQQDHQGSEARRGYRGRQPEVTGRYVRQSA